LVKKVEWSTPDRFETKETVTFGYADEAPFLITIETDKNLTESEIEIAGTLQWVACSEDTCLPGVTPFAAKLKVGPQAKKNSDQQKRIEEVRAALPQKLTTAQATKQDNTILLSVQDNEIAMNNNAPVFFPEKGVDPHLPVTLKPQASGPTHIALPAQKNDTQLKGVLVVGDAAYDIDLPLVQARSTEGDLSFIWAIVFALIGGMILNLMPCVLPIVSLKVMSFVKIAAQSRRELIKHGILFTFGVLISFWTLAIILIFLQMSGQAVGWGFQLQDPFFIACLSLLFTLLGMSLFGVFELGTQFAAYAGEAAAVTKRKGYLSSFWSGIFATAVATPCTGPFMGSALGYAMTQPAYVSLLVFTALGLGLSLPYLFMGAFPATIRWLPKPGAWMESFKQFLGFLMLITVLWLLWVFEGQTNREGLFALLSALLIAAVGAWIFGRFATPVCAPQRRKVGYALTALLVGGALLLARVASDQSESSPSQVVSEKVWEPYSVERLQALREKKVPVLIDFTAKWCLICQTNHFVLSQNKVQKKLDELGVVRMKADWTRYDAAITAALRKHGRSGVPLYVLYGADRSNAPLILPQVLTAENVISALESHVQ
jgi:thiol:disulfide interchange protein